MKSKAFVAFLLISILVVTALYFYNNLEKYFWPSLVPPAAYWADKDKPLDEQTAQVEIGERKFEIPLAYIQSKKPVGGVFKDSILLNIVWPDMESLRGLQTNQNYQKAIQEERRRGDILLMPTSSRPSLSVQISNREQGLIKLEYAGKHGDLDKYNHYHGTKEKADLWEEFFLEKTSDGKIKSYIECTPFARAPTPTCKHVFNDRGIEYLISYNRKNFFSDWKLQREKAIKFIDNFEINPNSGEENGYINAKSKKLASG